MKAPLLKKKKKSSIIEIKYLKMREWNSTKTSIKASKFGLKNSFEAQISYDLSRIKNFFENNSRNL